MKNELFAELMGSADEALEHARGKRELRTTRLPPPHNGLFAPVTAATIAGGIISLLVEIVAKPFLPPWLHWLDLAAAALLALCCGVWMLILMRRAVRDDERARQARWYLLGIVLLSAGIVALERIHDPNAYVAGATLLASMLAFWRAVRLSLRSSARNARASVRA